MNTEGINNSYNEPVEALRVILAQEQARPVSYEEALEIGNSLLEFY